MAEMKDVGITSDAAPAGRPAPPGCGAPCAAFAPPQESASSSPAAQPGLAVWEFAGLLLTYWCNARCAFCYVYSGPDRRGDMHVNDAVRLWRGLDDLASAHGRTMRVHLAGGEPFGDWPRLLATVRAAREAGLSRLEKVETNAFWATHDGLTRARLEQLDALGMEKLVVSTDVYHQEFIPAERVARCVRIARQVLGRGRVKVRWWDFHRDPTDLRHASRPQRLAAYRAAWTRHRDRLTGRASQRLAPLLERHPPERFRGDHCVVPVLQSRHVHIDGYGNVFPGVCSGIILGNALRSGVERLWSELAGHWRSHPVLAAVVQGGSFALYEQARKLGYRPLAGGYADKCHLCQHVRQFLLELGGWERWLGPRECYANARDRCEAGQWNALVALTQSKPTERTRQRAAKRADVIEDEA